MYNHRTVEIGCYAKPALAVPRVHELWRPWGCAEVFAWIRQRMTMFLAALRKLRVVCNTTLFTLRNSAVTVADGVGPP